MPALAKEDRSRVVIKNTFIDVVDSPTMAFGCGPLRARASSDPTLFERCEMEERRMSGGGEGPVEFELCGLENASDSEARTEEEEVQSAALPCYHHIQEEIVACGADAGSQWCGSEDSTLLHHEGRGWPEEPTCSGTGSKVASSPEGSPEPSLAQEELPQLNEPEPEDQLQRLLDENKRLSMENSWLRRHCLEAFSAQACPAPVEVNFVWPVACNELACNEGWAAGAVATAVEQPKQTAQAQADGTELRTTVMLRNLPNNYSRAMVLAMLDGEGFAGEYDFLYLPMDFKSRACLGYAFVNFTDAAVVTRFWNKFDGYSRWILPSRKVCHVSWSGPHQGLEAHVERYRNSPVMHRSVPDEYKPVVFRDGVRIVFPQPTKTPRAPRIRNISEFRAMRPHPAHAAVP